MFTVKNLQCIRRKKILFKQLNFELRPGGLLQIDGANGSGKSSLLKMCAGLIQTTTGNISWNNININDCQHDFQSNITYLGHANGIKAGLSVLENMKVMHALSGEKLKADYFSILERIGLAGMANVLSDCMSAGQKRRVGLSRILISPSSLWILDEPFNALDENGKKLIETLMVAHCNTGGMVIFATHQAVEIKTYPLQRIKLGQSNDWI